jgi:hypothetical protein
LVGQWNECFLIAWRGLVIVVATIFTMNARLTVTTVVTTFMKLIMLYERVFPMLFTPLQFELFSLRSAFL